MPLTIVSVIFSLILLLLPSSVGLAVHNPHFGWISLAFSSLILLAVIILQSTILSPLEKTEKSMVSRVIELYRRDRLLAIGQLWFFFFPLLTLFLIFAQETILEHVAFPLWIIWIIAAGFTLDLLHQFYKRTINFLNPYALASKITHEAKSCIQNDRSAELCDWIDSLSETGLKAIDRNSTSLALTVLDELQELVRIFLESAKSINHPAERVSYTLFFVFQRIELIHEKAVEKRLEPICSAVYTTLGKITLHAAHYDITVAGYPIHILGKLAERAQAEKIPEIADRASRTYIEVAKELINSLDVTYLEIKEPFLTMTTHLHQMAKESFRQDKTQNITVLTLPFNELKEIIQSPKLASHPDTPAILDGINQALAEFSALELVMKTIPTIPAEETDKEPPAK